MPSRATGAALDIAESPVNRSGTGAARGGPRKSGTDSLLDRHLKRLEPDLAASFTEAQRQAIKGMLGLREPVRHIIELRRSLPFFTRRYYFVLLFGREKRSLARLYSEGQNSAAFTLLFYVVAGLLAIVPLLLLLYLL